MYVYQAGYLMEISWKSRKNIGGILISQTRGIWFGETRTAGDQREKPQVRIGATYVDDPRNHISSMV